ncbi:MAG TPA: DUF1588 domain-containing protein [Myxococcaceae bacterium]|nr:DUF1588 domain-containing protein [Myxococcaceae bacterium]
MSVGRSSAWALLLCCACYGKARESLLGTPPSPTPPSPTPPPIPTSAYDPSFACPASGPVVSASAIRRQAKVHYVNTLREFLSPLSATDLTAVMGTIQAQIDLMPEDSSPFFSHNDTSLTPSHAGAAFEIGFALGNLLAANDTYVGELASVCGAGSTRASLTGTCANAFVTHFALKAFRRPPTAAEVADLLVDPTSTTTPPAKLDLTTTQGLAPLLIRLLAHPRLFYRLDDEGALVAGTDGSGGTYQLSKYELLSKLTYLFWDAPPTDALYLHVHNADLTQPSQRTALVSTLLGDPRARAGVGDFYAEWLGLENIPQLDSMNSLSYKTFAAGENINVAGHNHRADMIREIVDLTSHYTFNGTGRYEDLMNSPYSFARTTDLAQLYGLTTAWDCTDKTLVPFPSSAPRSGLLTRAAFLITGVEYTDPIIKGKHIRFQILCDVLPPPPPTVNVVPVKQDAVHTTRYLSEQATAGTASDPMQCMGCHQWMNPLGFATESYDSLGRYRTVEKKFDPTTGQQDGQVPVTTAVTGYLFTNDTQQLASGTDLNA